MKTTEMFVEQILIGGVLLLIVFLLVPDITTLTIPKNCNINGALVSALVGASTLGIAYFLGILYDRVADTLLEDQEQRSRLQHALKRIIRGRVSLSADDLFPVHEFRLQVLAGAQGISEHASYLRSRIRLLRALTTLIPALTVSYIIYSLICEKKPGWQDLRIVGTVGLLLVYRSVFLYKASDWGKRRWRNGWDVPPNTYFDHEKYLSKQIFFQSIQKHLEKKWAWRDPVFLGFWILIILSAFLRFSKEKISTFWILPFFGLFLTLLCGWAYLRVHKTFLFLLDDYHEYDKCQHLPADTPVTKITDR